MSSSRLIELRDRIENLNRSVLSCKHFNGNNISINSQSIFNGFRHYNALVPSETSTYKPRKFSLSDLFIVQNGNVGLKSEAFVSNLETNIAGVPDYTLYPIQTQKTGAIAYDDGSGGEHVIEYWRKYSPSEVYTFPKKALSPLNAPGLSVDTDNSLFFGQSPLPEAIREGTITLTFYQNSPNTGEISGYAYPVVNFIGCFTFSGTSSFFRTFTFSCTLDEYFQAFTPPDIGANIPVYSSLGGSNINFCCNWLTYYIHAVTGDPLVSWYGSPNQPNQHDRFTWFLNDGSGNKIIDCIPWYSFNGDLFIDDEIKQEAFQQLIDSCGYGIVFYLTKLTITLDGDVTEQEYYYEMIECPYTYQQTYNIVDGWSNYPSFPKIKSIRGSYVLDYTAFLVQ